MGWARLSVFRGSPARPSASERSEQVGVDLPDYTTSPERCALSMDCQTQVLLFWEGGELYGGDGGDEGEVFDLIDKGNDDILPLSK